MHTPSTIDDAVRNHSDPASFIKNLNGIWTNVVVIVVRANFIMTPNAHAARSNKIPYISWWFSSSNHGRKKLRHLQHLLFSFTRFEVGLPNWSRKIGIRLEWTTLHNYFFTSSHAREAGPPFSLTAPSCRDRRFLSVLTFWWIIYLHVFNNRILV